MRFPERKVRISIILSTIQNGFLPAIHVDYSIRMNFGKSKLPWIIMVRIMILMLTQGFGDTSTMFVMMLSVMVVLMMFWMKKKNN